MTEQVDLVEATRARYRPKQILTLFVGESAPHSGKFFYFGNTSMARCMKKAIEAEFGVTSDFLQTFMAFGWYLDDLVLAPVNNLQGSKRKVKCVGAQDDLSRRIARYRPAAIVSLLRRIKPFVEAAARAAGSDAPHYSVPFPGNGQQARFRTEMARIFPKLPRST